jgi:hypothetical protein
MAGRHVQPTPRSLAAAEQKLGEISMETVELVKQAMTRARAADGVGDNPSPVNMRLQKFSARLAFKDLSLAPRAVESLESL